MKPVIIDHLVIGSGRPKICVPIVAHTPEELKAQADEIASLPADLAEWRVDFFDECQSREAVRQAARTLKNILQMPLLFTFRTANEGGEREIAAADYRDLLLFAASLDEISLVDVEVFFGHEECERETVADIVRGVHEAGKYVLASNHDFQKTPPSEELKKRLLYMEETGADIAKIAVMPQTKSDVFRLMEVTAAVQEQIPENIFSPASDTICEDANSGKQVHSSVDIPVVTMSMGSLGVLSRVAGEFTGSAITFGAAGQTSAPGQVEVRKLSEMMERLHEIY
ncbi:MAG: type I 3-dehydroquinate dehydratase [Lachnospiraceae bacterium]|nr:type I 3-dehydroquinate dehydratase [Lachnospiraceae bacterium]